MQLSPAAHALILDFEGIDQPSAWPGEQSGITLGHGYDLSACTRREFIEAWARHLSGSDMQALSAVIGLSGEQAKAVAKRFANIRITPGMALEVFERVDVPRMIDATLTVFPGVEKLPPDAAGALVSLVFNRGPRLSGASRIEMREIRAAVMKMADGRMTLAKGLTFIAGRITAMKRLWSSNRGLRRRRDAEAALVLSAIPKP